jgi:hypothetical protein
MLIDIDILSISLLDPTIAVKVLLRLNYMDDIFSIYDASDMRSIEDDETNCGIRINGDIVRQLVQSTQATAIAERGIGDRKQQLNYTSYEPETLT